MEKKDIWDRLPNDVKKLVNYRSKKGLKTTIVDYRLKKDLATMIATVLDDLKKEKK